MARATSKGFLLGEKREYVLATPGSPSIAPYRSGAVHLSKTPCC